MDASVYKHLYDELDHMHGWDFSKLQVISEGVKWELYEEVIKRCERSDILLDVGTGGGEHIIQIASSFLFLVGIDISSDMVQAAQTNLRKSKVSNIRFSEMTAEDLQFPTGFFDVITCRQAPFNAKEIAKVLKKGGSFFTQQVCEADKLNLKIAFGRGQQFGVCDGALKEKAIEDLKEAGFTCIQSFEYDATEYYQRPEDLLFLLKHTPIIPDFGKDPKDFDILNHFIYKNRTERGIPTNSKRFMLTATF